MAALTQTEAASAAEAAELITSLARHGLCALLAIVEGREQVELEAGREPADRLLLDLRSAIRAWRAGWTLAPVSLRNGTPRYVFERDVTQGRAA